MKEKWIKYSPIPAALAIGFVPLITTAKRYETGLTGYKWFSSAMEKSLDIFLYYKAQALIILAFLMFFAAVIGLTSQQTLKLEGKKLLSIEMIFAGAYLVLSLLSAALSEFGSVAFTGGYEQWEGFTVLLAYVILMAYVYLVVDSDQAIFGICRAIIAGSLVCGGIGAFQYLHLDFFKSSLGSWFMNLFMKKSLNFSFNFPEGQSYATLYNPNYIGSYVALVMPILLFVVFVQWGKISKLWQVLAIVSTCFNFVSLVGSQSLTGAVGLVVCAVFAFVYLLPQIIDKIGGKMLGALTGVCLVFFLIFALVFPERLESATKKLFKPNKDSHTIEKMITDKSGVEITTIYDETIKLTMDGENFALTDAKGQNLVLEQNAKDGGMQVKGSDSLSDLRFFGTTIKVEDKAVPAVQVQTRYNYKSWYICQQGGSYKLCNAFGQLDNLVEIPAVGFEDNLHFGDKRGYIWSRTFPLLKDRILLGSGPNTFTEVFPNNDYVGMNNLNYYGSTVTKPHNMYLQIWVQTGLISLIAFLLLGGFYVIKSLILYWKRPLVTFKEGLGVAVMISVMAYLVTGIANDSTVAVAPVYWGLLGLGLALNRMNRKKPIDKDNEV
ncbi:MAG: O-antigen ligase family protein [Eubacterium sp.]|nr:O-antigen ligase family protein [Eubacterium sp.]